MNKLEQDYEYGDEPVTAHDYLLEDETPPQGRMHATNNDDKESNSVKADGMSSETAQTEMSINFKTVIEKFTNKERCEKAVDQDLADMVNNLFRDAIPDDKYNELVKKYNRPENCEGLSTVRVNQLVWDIIRPESRSLDVKFQAIQGSLLKGSAAITQLVTELAGLTKEKNATVNVHKLLDLSTDALALLGNTNRLLNLRRRDCMKSDLRQDYVHLCSTTVPFTDYLFGDDVSKTVKDIQEVNRAGQKIGTVMATRWQTYEEPSSRR